MRWLAVRVKTLLAGIALAVFLSSAPTAHANALKAMWGPSIHDGVSLFPTYRELGVKIYEDDLHWNLIAPRRPSSPRNPNDPAYVWLTEVAQAVAEAKRYHMQVALQIIGAPPWANGGKPWNWAPLHTQDYANFAIAASKRYTSVHLWMIWGEPSRSQDFEPLTPAKRSVKLDAQQQVAPHLYARILDAAYGAVKSVSRSNLVIGGMTYTTGEISPAHRSIRCRRSRTRGHSQRRTHGSPCVAAFRERASVSRPAPARDLRPARDSGWSR
jgi:hypothetical protein